MSKRSLKFLQLAASIGLLLIVFYQVGLYSDEGRKVFSDVIKQADIKLLIACILVSVLVNMSSVLKWAMLARAQGLQAGYWRFFNYYLIGQFYNFVLPTSVGGDVVRAYELGKHTGKQDDALASVLVERYTGVLVLFIISGVCVLSQLALFSVNFVLFSLAVFAVLLGLITWMIFDSTIYNNVKNILLFRYAFMSPVFKKLDDLLYSIKGYGEKRSTLVWAFVNSFVFYLLAVVNVYVTALVFDLNIGFVDMLIATPIIMLIMNLPISIGNLGLMEFAYINIFQLMGYSSVIALSVAILMRLKSIIDGAAGGMLHPLYVTKKYSKN